MTEPLPDFEKMVQDGLGFTPARKTGLASLARHAYALGLERGANISKGYENPLYSDEVVTEFAWDIAEDIRQEARQAREET